MWAPSAEGCGWEPEAGTTLCQLTDLTAGLGLLCDRGPGKAVRTAWGTLVGCLTSLKVPQVPGMAPAVRPARYAEGLQVQVWGQRHRPGVVGSWKADR